MRNPPSLLWPFPTLTRMASWQFVRDKHGGNEPLKFTDGTLRQKKKQEWGLGGRAQIRVGIFLWEVCAAHSLGFGAAARRLGDIGFSVAFMSALVFRFPLLVFSLALFLWPLSGWAPPRGHQNTIFHNWKDSKKKQANVSLVLVWFSFFICIFRLLGGTCKDVQFYFRVWGSGFWEVGGLGLLMAVQAHARFPRCSSVWSCTLCAFQNFADPRPCRSDDWFVLFPVEVSIPSSWHLSEFQQGTSKNGSDRAEPRTGDRSWLLRGFLSKSWRIDRPRIEGIPSRRLLCSPWIERR